MVTVDVGGSELASGGQLEQQLRVLTPNQKQKTERMQSIAERMQGNGREDAVNGREDEAQ